MFFLKKDLHVCRLAANARAAAVWLVAEHGAHHPRAAAVLAHMAASFADQVRGRGSVAECTPTL